MQVRHVSAYYGSHKAVADVSLDIRPRAVTALIGPSGCGKSTFLRCLNRMHEVTPGANRVEGQVLLDGQDIYAPRVDPVQVRRHIGMVFQKPNPFPSMSIYDNVVAGLKLTRAPARADPGRDGGALPAPGRPVGRGEGPAEGLRGLAVRGPAAAPVHRPGPGHAAPGAS